MKDAHFPDKYMKKLQSLAPGFTDVIDSADVEEIKKKILASERNIYEIEEEKDNNSKLLEVKELMKELAGPYRDAKSTETAKIKYALFTLQERGVKI